MSVFRLLLKEGLHRVHQNMYGEGPPNVVLSQQDVGEWGGGGLSSGFQFYPIPQNGL